MNSVHKLRPELEEEFPGCKYVSRTTTYRGVKGRFLGFDMGDGLQVGVFSRANSNTARIVVKGYDENRQDEINTVQGKLQNLGFHFM